MNAQKALIHAIITFGELGVTIVMIIARLVLVEEKINAYLAILVKF